jgi:hypothetical protein
MSRMRSNRRVNTDAQPAVCRPRLCAGHAHHVRHSMRWLKLAKVLWASPYSVVGLALAAFPLAAGGNAKWSNEALEITYRPSNAHCGRLARALPFRGIVFGHVILAVTQKELAVIGPHERVHIEQYERWGTLFFLAYAASSLRQLVGGRNPYWDNHFEVQARERANPNQCTKSSA